jgi:7-cyano-7-deazaguanine synthase
MPEAKKGANPAKAVVLLSSGLDSSFNLYKAREKYEIVLALTFNYGQRAVRREIECAQKLAAVVNVPHKVLDLTWFRDFTSTSLVSGKEIPTGQDVEIDSLSRSLETAKSVWVPNRNGIFLNIAAGFAEGLKAQVVIPGFNYEEAQTFPDNSRAFLKALDQSFSYSTESRVVTECFSAEMNKSQIVSEAIRIGVPLVKLWPCYFDGDTWCGTCESCQRFKRAVEANGIDFEELRKERK